MNQQDILAQIQAKEAALQHKRDFTLNVFNLIKDDCVDIITQKQIDCNFEYSTTLYSRIITKLIVEKLKLNVDHYSFELNVVHGVEKAYILPSFDRSFSNKVHDKEAQQMLVNTIDAALLCTKLRSYIIGKGFTGNQYTHRFSNKTCRVLEFKTTKQTLLNQTTQSPSTTENTDKYAIIGVLAFVLITGLGYLVSVLV